MEIKKIIQIPKNTSPGPDKIIIEVLAECLYYIAGPLSTIINQSFKSGIFPDALKVASIMRTLKKLQEKHYE